MQDLARWVKGWESVARGLLIYVKDYHPTGLAWRMPPRVMPIPNTDASGQSPRRHTLRRPPSTLRPLRPPPSISPCVCPVLGLPSRTIIPTFDHRLPLHCLQTLPPLNSCLPSVQSTQSTTRGPPPAPLRPSRPATSWQSRGTSSRRLRAAAGSVDCSLAARLGKNPALRCSALRSAHDHGRGG